MARLRYEARPTDEVSYADALRWEENRWPGYRLRGAFWRRPEIPSELRDGAGPGPRMVLGSEANFTRFKREAEAFTARRRTWLLTMVES